MSEPSGRPILFSGAMVRAILSGQKTQTRRPVKPQPPAGYDRVEGPVFSGPVEAPLFAMRWENPGAPGDLDLGMHTVRCPYGSPGDRLWVREAFEEVEDRAARKAVPPDHFRAALRYRADDARLSLDVHMEHWRCKHECPARWTPGIHMPRWASRLTLEVTGVRVERLQAITEEEAEREGVDAIPVADVRRQATWTKRADFAQLWERINGKGAWDANPWVWAVSFRRLP